MGVASQIEPLYIVASQLNTLTAEGMATAKVMALKIMAPLARVAGATSSATGGLMPGKGGKIDVRKLTPQQYREIREKNPELLGLAPKRR